MSNKRVIPNQMGREEGRRRVAERERGKHREAEGATSGACKGCCASQRPVRLVRLMTHE